MFLFQNSIVWICRVLDNLAQCCIQFVHCIVVPSVQITFVFLHVRRRCITHQIACRVEVRTVVQEEEGIGVLGYNKVRCGLYSCFLCPFMQMRLHHSLSPGLKDYTRSLCPSSRRKAFDSHIGQRNDDVL